jgi:hypothetical protein
LFHVRWFIDYAHNLFALWAWFLLFANKIRAWIPHIIEI